MIRNKSKNKIKKKKLHHFLKISIFIGLLLLIYGIFVEPQFIKITHYNLSNTKLAGIKIVFAADFHIAPHEKHRLNKIIDVINQQKADIIILGGDYAKGHKESSSMPIERIVDSLKKLHAPYGIYAVIGNHDIYYGKQKVITALKSAKIPVLDNRNLVLNIKNHLFTLAGVADYRDDKPDLTKALKDKLPTTILISHSPDIYPQKPNVDLILAAHTHGGQVRIPFIGSIIVPSIYGRRYDVGLFNENNILMLVSKGLGTSRLPIRINCTPEIVVIDFK